MKGHQLTGAQGKSEGAGLAPDGRLITTTSSAWPPRLPPFLIQTTKYLMSLERVAQTCARTKKITLK